MSTQRLAAILFADIVGYTATMEKDRSLAEGQIGRFRAALTQQVSHFQGEVIHFYGDGCLATFDQVESALSCALVIQQSFQADPILPVRIGLHYGEVHHAEDHTFGDAINLASRIESMGIPGSVLFSEEVWKLLPSDSSFELKPLGHFSFKNVSHPKQVWALAHPGIKVPQKKDVQRGDKAHSVPPSWQRILGSMGLYLAAGAGGLQLLRWSLDQMNWSPYWGDLALWLGLGMLPSIGFLYSRSPYLSHKWLRYFPILNLALVGILLFFVFRGVDLGPTTTEVSFENSLGEIESSSILKQAFRTPVAIFNFSSIQEDPAHEWMGFGLKRLLELDLAQDKHLHVSPYLDQVETTSEKIKELRLAGETYIDGSYEVKEGQYFLTPIIHNSRNGRSIATKEFIGRDLLGLIDSMSIFLRRELGVSEQHIHMSPDLPIKEFISPSLQAIEYFTLGCQPYFLTDRIMAFEYALEADSAFAMAWLEKAKIIRFYNQGQAEEAYCVERAYRYRNRLPAAQQFEVLLYRHLTRKEWQEAEKMARLQIALDPANQTFHDLLTHIYTETHQVDKLVEQVKSEFEREETTDSWVAYIRGLMINGEASRIVRKLKPYRGLAPTDIRYLDVMMRAYLLDEDFDQARSMLEQIKLINPDFEYRAEVYSPAIQFMESRNWNQEESIALSGTYRAHIDESIRRIWRQNGIWLQQYSNQYIAPIFPSGQAQFAEGDVLQSAQSTLLSDDQGQAYLLKTEQRSITPGKNDTFWFWKIDESIRRADSALALKDSVLALRLYREAKAQNPKHFFLDEMIKYLDYQKSHSLPVLTEQYQAVSGQYGPRKVWVEEGNLYYKRAGGARLRLLPVGNKRYLNRSSLDLQFEFDLEQGKAQGIRLWSYDPAQSQWVEIEGTYTPRDPG